MLLLTRGAGGLLAATWMLCLAPAAPAVVIADAKKPRATVTLDAGRLTPAQQAVADEAQQWLIDAIEKASGARLPAAAKAPDGTVIVLTTASAQPETAKRLRLRDHHDAYSIETTPDRVTLIGANVYALRHAVAHLLRNLGFRYYAPSPKWHVIPSLETVRVETNANEVPALGSRSIWYAYGQPDKPLMENYRRWAAAQRLSSDSLVHTGHSYGNIILRNAKEFEQHPEYYALLEDGKRDNQRAVAARKFCFSNPGLMELVARDRIKLLEENRKTNPLAYMVSVDPSDGQGTCHCEQCKKLGTTTDRVVYLANHVAREINKAHPGSWVGLYAYSSHRLPPTNALEPNVFVQVALGFNQTEFSLPELVERWSKKAPAIGLREYYGVEAWDWGLPGQMRGAKTAYHAEWIPFYAARKAASLSAETNANWGGQTLGLDVAAELMWNPKADVAALRQRYLTDCFGPAAPVMAEFQKKLESFGPLQPASLSALFADLDKAVTATTDAKVRARLVDLMAYLVYVEEYRRFQSVAAAQPGRNDKYYDALKVLMTYAWRIRGRDVVHYYALARRLCNGLPVQDKRPDFYMGRKDKPPVWMAGEQLTDAEVEAKFREYATSLKADATRLVTYSRSFQRVRPEGPDDGPSRLLGGPKDECIAAFRKTVRGYLVLADQEEVVLGIQATGKSATLTILGSKDEELVKETVQKGEAFTEVKFKAPRANDYRFVLEGEARVRVKPGTPLLYEASVGSPAWVDYSGPHYFYVPRGVKKLYADAAVRLSLVAPGQAKRIDVTPATRAPGQSYTVVDVPEGADGKLWHTDANTRGTFFFLNVPPLLSLSREKFFVPREVAESDGLTTGK
jgi:hypothetical protein